MPNFEDVWCIIVAHAGEQFETIKGLDFTYQLENNYLLPNRANIRISKNDFAKAYLLVPFSGPGVVNKIVMGPAYVWAVLHDRRIRGNDR